ncbi:hypothetical protein C7460_11543 [Marinoscillum furvescens DSM 4134]|uniref:Uncharacterized protein n=1 Tax=Marinoscillum furvescens DSM 4134 TaxID=1122208 RepID=A0A3D9L080_MARFU|nr:hypothetical protein C7460_11543 [Marinoscillum furvescens DSM 4134]
MQLLLQEQLVNQFLIYLNKLYIMGEVEISILW